MFQPDLYNKSNNLVCTKNVEELNKYFDLLKLRSDGEDRILDIGSADGETTVEIILNRFPSKRETIIGFDIADEMVDYANKKYENNERVSFRKLDIETNELPRDFLGSFDHVFSLFLLHWAKNLEHMLNNMYQLLKPGGDLFLVFLGKHSVFPGFTQLKMNPKWTPFMDDVPFSMFQDMEHPDKFTEETLLKVRFTVISCKICDTAYVCDEKEYRNLLTSSNLTLKHIPKSTWPGHMDEYLSYVYNTGFVKNENGRITDNFTLVTIVARKPMT